MKKEWCWAQERGLPKPDLVLFLELPLEKAAKRNGYGNEQYENHDFQKKVLKNYQEMVDSSWRVSIENKRIEYRVSLLFTHIKNCKREFVFLFYSELL